MLNNRIALRLFGPPRLERGGAPVTIERRTSMASLEYLAAGQAVGAAAGQADAPAAHSRETRATLLWPEAAAAQAQAY